MHPNYKEAIIKARDNDTVVILKNTGAPVRVLKNRLTRKYLDMERKNIIDEDLLAFEKEALKKGIFEGDLDMGCMPLGQIAGLVREIKPVGQILDDIMNEAFEATKALNDSINRLKGGK